MAEFPWTWERLLWKESWADGGEKMNELEEVALCAGSLSQVFSLTAAKDLTGLQVRLTHYDCIFDCNYFIHFEGSFE